MIKKLSNKVTTCKALINIALMASYIWVFNPYPTPHYDWYPDPIAVPYYGGGYHHHHHR